MDWKSYAWLKRGKRRTAILSTIASSSNPLSANDIRLSNQVSISQASRVLSELLTKELITCKNPEDNIGRLYTVSPKGARLLEKLSTK